MRYLVLGFTFFLIACLPVKANDRFLDIREVKSKSGITAWLVEDHALPIIFLQFSFKGAGAIRDGGNGRRVLYGTRLRVKKF